MERKLVPKHLTHAKYLGKVKLLYHRYNKSGFDNYLKSVFKISPSNNWEQCVPDKIGCKHKNGDPKVTFHCVIARGDGNKHTCRDYDYARKRWNSITTVFCLMQAQKNRLIEIYILILNDSSRG